MELRSIIWNYWGVQKLNINKYEGKSEDNSLVQSVDRALQILCAFDVNEHELSIQQLSTMLGLPKSTTHRLLASLAYRGFIEQVPSTKNYRLGLKLRELGALVGAARTIDSEAGPILRRLIEQCGETVSISILDGIETVIVEKIECSQSMRVTSQIGRRNPIHCSGSGKVLLACQPMKVIKEILEKAPMTRYTANTITDPKKLIENLMGVRQFGFVVDDGEISDDQMCIAAPVWNGDGQAFAAITASGPASRIKVKGALNVASAVVEAADRLSRALGWTGNKWGFFKKLSQSDKERS